MIRQLFTLFLSALVAATPSLSLADKIDRKYTPGTMTRVDYNKAHTHLTDSKVDVLLGEASEAFGTKYIIDAIKKDYSKSPFQTKITFEDLTPFVKAWIVSLLLARLDFEDVAVSKLEAAVVEAGEMAEKLAQAHKLTVDEIHEVYSEISLIALTETFHSFGNLKAFEHQRIGRFVREISDNMKTTWDASILKKAGINFSMKPLWQLATTLPTVALAGSTFLGPLAYAVTNDNFNSYMLRSDYGLLVAAAGFVGIAASAVSVGFGTGMMLGNAVHSRGRRQALFRTFSPIGKECEKLLTESGEVVP